MTDAAVRPAGRRMGRLLGAGGEADVHEVPGRPSLAFKRYRRADPARAAKLQVMLDHPPAHDGGTALAWPVEVVLDPHGGAEGFLMPRVDLTTHLPLFRVYNPQSRRTVAPGFTWRYLLRTARNVAAVVDSLHRAGYVIGDLNESNLLVSNRALVALVDCDSMQVTDPGTGEVHRCRVGKPEFTAPELHGADLAARDRTPASDSFALAVLAFLLLMEGAHPFGGVWRGRGEPPDIATRIRSGRFPYRWTTRSAAPPPMALDLAVLPPAVRALVRRSFGPGMRRPSRRPLPADWVAALESAEARVARCSRSPHHEYGDHLRRCPWCERIQAGMPDPFPGPGGTGLRPLPPTRAQLLRRALRDAVSGAVCTIISSAWRVLRSAPPLAGRSIARIIRPPASFGRLRPAARAVRAEAPALLGIGAVAAVTPVPVLVPVVVLTLAVVHASAPGDGHGHRGFRSVLATARRVPQDLVVSVRVACASAAAGAGITAAVAAALWLRSGPPHVLETFLAHVMDHRPWGAGLFAALAVRWPATSDPRWAQTVGRLRARLRRQRRSAAIRWLAGSGALCALLLAAQGGRPMPW